MHIALITHHYEPESNAPQRRWSALVPRLIAAGHRVTVFTPPPHYPSGQAGELSAALQPGSTTIGSHGETIARVRFRPHGPDLRSRSRDQAVAAIDSVWRAVRILGRPTGRPNVVISTVPGLPSIAAGWLVSKLLGARHVVEMRDAWPDLIAASGMLQSASRRRQVATALVARVVTRMQRSAAAVVTTTQSFAEVLRHRHVSEVAVVRNGASLDRIEPLPPRTGKLGSLHVLYAGTVGRSQGLTTAVQAAVLAERAGYLIRLRIVGSGAAETELRELATSLRAPVDFVERVPPSEIACHYQWADTTLVSLQDWAPFHWTVPSKVYEAIAYQRHVTGCVRGETAGIISSLGAGDVVDAGDALGLAKLWGQLASDRRRLHVGPKAREWALKNVNFDALAGRYLQILEDAVDRA